MTSEQNTGRGNTEFIRSPERRAPGIRVIINGQGEGAAMLLGEEIKRGHEVVGVIATIKKDGNGNWDPLRQKALDLGFPIVNLGDINLSNKSLTPEKYQAANQKLRDMRADLSVGFYLQPTMSDETIAIPEFGSMNTHYGALPENAGRDGMSRDVLAGNDIAITTFMMNSVIDGGDIVMQRTFPNPGDKSQGALYFQYLPDFVGFVADSVDKLAIGIDEFRKNGTPLPVTPQDLSKRTYFDPLTEEELRIDPENDSAELAKRKVLAGGPGATILIEGVKYKLGKPSVQYGVSMKPGRIIEKTDEGIMLELSQGILSLGRLQRLS